MKARGARTMTPAELEAVRTVAALPEESACFGYVQSDVPPGLRLSQWRRYCASVEAEAA